MNTSIRPATGTYTRMLLKAALLSAPLIGAFSILPMSLLMGSLAPEAMKAQMTAWRLLGAVGLLSFSTFMMWLVNIGLHSWYRRRAASSRWLWYMASYAFALCYIFVVSRAVQPAARANFDVGYLVFYPYLGAITNNTVVVLLLVMAPK